MYNNTRQQTPCFNLTGPTSKFSSITLSGHVNFFSPTTLCRPGSPLYRGFTITLTHNTVARTPLDEWSDRRRDLYLTTHNTHDRQTSMPPAGFEPATPASERPQTHALDREANGIGYKVPKRAHIDGLFHSDLNWFSLTSCYTMPGFKLWRLMWTSLMEFTITIWTVKGLNKSIYEGWRNKERWIDRYFLLN